MTQLSLDGDNAEEEGIQPGWTEMEAYGESLPRVAKKVDKLGLPGLKKRLGNRSLFIFSNENFIRKYAQMIIEWTYPL